MTTENSHNEQNNNSPELKEILGPNSEISAKLRQLFRTIEQEPLPEQYATLLAQLEEAENQQNNDPGA